MHQVSWVQMGQPFPSYVCFQTLRVPRCPLSRASCPRPLPAELDGASSATFRLLCCCGPDTMISGKTGMLFSSEYAKVSVSSADPTLFSATKTGTPSCKSQRPRCGSLPMMREAVDQIVPPTWLSRRYTTRCTQKPSGRPCGLHGSGENGLTGEVTLPTLQQ